MGTTTGSVPETVTNGRGDGRVSETVVRTVAAAKGVDPVDLEPLYDVVDPDALDAVFRSAGGSSSGARELRFSMADCRVVVHGDGTVTATPPGATEERASGRPAPEE